MSSHHQIPRSDGSGYARGRTEHLRGAPTEAPAEGAGHLWLQPGSSADQSPFWAVQSRTGAPHPGGSRVFKGPKAVILLQAPRVQQFCLPIRESHWVRAGSQFPGHECPAEESVLCYTEGRVPRGRLACCGVLCGSVVPASEKGRLPGAGKDQHCAWYFEEGKEDG